MGSAPFTHSAPEDVKSLLQQKFVHRTDFCTLSEKICGFFAMKMA
jgi:hypothetical protein